MVIVPKPKPQSPFCPEKPATEDTTNKNTSNNILHNNIMQHNIKPRGVLATSKIPEPPSKKNDLEEISIKTELIIEDTDNGNNNINASTNNTQGLVEAPQRSPIAVAPIVAPIITPAPCASTPRPQRAPITVAPIITPAPCASTHRPQRKLVTIAPIITPSPCASIPRPKEIEPTLTISNNVGRGTRSKSKKISKEVEDEIEEEESLLSDDSDDDRTWAPKKNDPNKTDPKVNNLIQTFQPRKRKRIGPDMVLKKKEKPSAPPATPVTPIVAPIIAPAPPSPIKKPRGRPKRSVKEESESNVSDTTDNDSSTDSGEFL